LCGLDQDKNCAFLNWTLLLFILSRGWALVEINALDEISKKAKSTKTYEIAAKHCPHSSCIVPSGIIKAVEVAAGFALPKNAIIKMEK
jgi:hypothetical protein